MRPILSLLFYTLHLNTQTPSPLLHPLLPSSVPFWNVIPELLGSVDEFKPDVVSQIVFDQKVRS